MERAAYFSIVFFALMVRASAATPVLGLYLVSQQEEPNRHYVEAPDIPEPGYIATQPDLRIEHLDMVEILQTPHGPTSLTLRIYFGNDDAKALAHFTRRHPDEYLILQFGKKILWEGRFGGKALTRALQFPIPDGIDAEALRNDVEAACPKMEP